MSNGSYVHQALREAKTIEDKIHNRVQYLSNQEHKVMNQSKQARDVVKKILEVKQTKNEDYERLQQLLVQQTKIDRQVAEESKRVRQQ